jgi:hypothetical protein
MTVSFISIPLSSLYTVLPIEQAGFYTPAHNFKFTLAKHWCSLDHRLTFLDK